MVEAWSRTSPPPLALDLIAKVEAFSARAYADSVGRMTIGYGSTVMPDGRAVRGGDVISVSDGRALLMRQAQAWCMATCRLVAGVLTLGEAAALLSFVHNLGEGALAGSTLRRMLNAGRHDLAQRQFGGWVMAGGQKSLGLMRRRELERRIFAGSGLGEYDAVWRMNEAELEPFRARAATDAAAWQKGAACPATTVGPGSGHGEPGVARPASVPSTGSPR